AIYLPTENHQRNVYVAFVEAYIKSRGRRGLLDYYAPKLTGVTGYDDGTVRKIVRKLVNSGFVKIVEHNFFSPTLRVKKKSLSDNEFVEILTEYSAFILKKNQYRDWWG
ncbi:unnamed protein product, partial [marine sediment metagenome]